MARTSSSGSTGESDPQGRMTPTGLILTVAAIFACGYLVSETGFFRGDDSPPKMPLSEPVDVVISVPRAAGNFGVDASSPVCTPLPSLVESIGRYSCRVSTTQPTILSFDSAQQCLDGGRGYPVYVNSPARAGIRPVNHDGCVFGFELTVQPRL